MGTLSTRLAVADQTCLRIAQESETGSKQGPRSHLADGRIVSWTSPPPRGLRLAIDAEITDQPVPPALARRFGIGDPRRFWPAWTAVEVSCKLRDVPVLIWLRHRGLAPDPEIWTRTLYLKDVTVTWGAAVVPTSGLPGEPTYDFDNRRTNDFARPM